MKRLTAPLILALAVVAGAPGGPAFAQLTREHIEIAVDLLENQITVASEKRCALYDPNDYSYNSQELKDALIASLGGAIVSFYTGERFTSPDDVDLDHLVALSEAHDSGACAWSSQQKKAFIKDPINHSLASPRQNREEKQGKDWAEWRPPLNSTNLQNWCFAAMRIVSVKGFYELTVDPEEYINLAGTLEFCLERYAAPAAE